jgi:glyoxylase-like metal-dependent hydrolase (beta-lactamase superfamily II)
MQIYHINCGTLKTKNGPEIYCHCLLLKEDEELALVDTGIGMQDVLHPEQRIGIDIIAQFGFQFDMNATAYHQIEAVGLDPQKVKHCILTHLDQDHTGGLADFPSAKLHVAETALKSYKEGGSRYSSHHLEHQPPIITYNNLYEDWFGFHAARVRIPFIEPVFLVALPGHTFGHCGVAIKHDGRWQFHIGDAYYLRAELFDPNHPAIVVSQMSAMDPKEQSNTVKKLKQLLHSHGDEIDIFGFHDPSEFYTMQKKSGYPNK